MSNVIDFARAKRQRTAPDDHFGVCPRCMEAGNYADQIWRNVGREHYLCCDKHNVYWWVGSNLFSNWHHETEEMRQQNAAKLTTMRLVAEVRLP